MYRVVTKYLEIYTDGACFGNPGPGGWGAILIWGDKTKEISGCEPNTTNNRMELKAAIEALKSVKSNVPIKIYTDSQYVKKGITEWINLWIHTNWNRGKVKNVELWKELHDLNKKFKVEWYWVKGHSGHEMNERVDQIAKDAISLNIYDEKEESHANS